MTLVKSLSNPGKNPSFCIRSEEMKAIKLRNIYIDEDLLNQLGELPHMFVAKKTEKVARRKRWYLIRSLYLVQGKTDDGQTTWVFTEQGNRPL